MGAACQCVVETELGALPALLRRWGLGLCGTVSQTCRHSQQVTCRLPSPSAMRATASLGALLSLLQ